MEENQEQINNMNDEDFKDLKSDRSHVVLWAKELGLVIVFLRPLGLRLLKKSKLNARIILLHEAV